MHWDVFISHASEDKEAFVRPLATILDSLSAKVWFDEFELKPGADISGKINHGLANSRSGVIVLSKDFIRKSWTQFELSGLIDRYVNDKSLIVPVWLNVNRDEISKFSPSIANLYAIDASTQSAMTQDSRIPAGG